MRASTVLGVVGAGGIGQELKNSMDLLDFPRPVTITAMRYDPESAATVLDTLRVVARTGVAVVAS